jgi:hypothetical protein
VTVDEVLEELALRSFGEGDGDGDGERLRLFMLVDSVALFLDAGAPSVERKRRLEF